MLFKRGVDDLAAHMLQPTNGPFLVVAHHLAVASDVRRENSREPTMSVRMSRKLFAHHNHHEMIR
ncbi:hypothetical protein ASE63_23645 [Bosea sp. Root381]|nr:hypothetical protein ASE63_23645 [Bosea sp. Root381]